HRAVDDDRRCFLAAAGIEIEVPGEPELLDIVLVDFVERAEALLIVGAPMAQPFGIVLRSREQALRIDGGSGRTRLTGDEPGHRSGEQAGLDELRSNTGHRLLYL